MRISLMFLFVVFGSYIIGARYPMIAQKIGIA